MKAEIISVGTELLLGQIVDTNSPYIASRLPDLGIDLYYVSLVGDNRARLVAALRLAWERSDLIITTGGLGPTEDDITREAIAETVGEEMYIDGQLEQELRDFFAKRSFPMPERNVKQATLLPCAKAIPNPRGTAPGWWVEKKGRIVIAIPGPPSEMQRMWEKELTARLRALSGGEAIVSRTLKTVGIGEGSVDEMVSPLLSSCNPTLAVYAKEDGIHLRLTAKAASDAKAEALLAPMEAEVRRIMGAALWGTDDDTLEGVVGAMLRAQGLTVATMESCTGGLLASVITDAAGSSDYFRGAIVSYATNVKSLFAVPAQLIEEHGVISPQVAKAMAAAVRTALEADVGIGITGVAGPDTVEDKPVGTVHIGLSDGSVERELSGQYPPTGRLAVKRRAVTTALLLLRRHLLETA